MSIEPKYTTNEAAKLLNIKPSYLRQLMSARKIAYIKGRPARFTEAMIKEYERKRTKRARV